MEIFLAKNIISDVSNELWACLLYFIYTGCSSPAQHRLVGRTSVRTRGGCQQIRAISRAFLRTSEIPPPRMPSFLPPFPIPRPLPRPGPRPLLKYRNTTTTTNTTNTTTTTTTTTTTKLLLKTYNYYHYFGVVSVSWCQMCGFTLLVLMELKMMRLPPCLFSEAVYACRHHQLSPRQYLLQRKNC